MGPLTLILLQRRRKGQGHLPAVTIHHRQNSLYACMRIPRCIFFSFHPVQSFFFVLQIAWHQRLLSSASTLLQTASASHHTAEAGWENSGIFRVGTEGGRRRIRHICAGHSKRQPGRLVSFSRLGTPVNSQFGGREKVNQAWQYPDTDRQTAVTLVGTMTRI